MVLGKALLRAGAQTQPQLRGYQAAPLIPPHIPTTDYPSGLSMLFSTLAPDSH